MQTDFNKISFSGDSIFSMTSHTSNEQWADKLIDGLIAQGIDYFCCCPGSRSSPLLVAIAKHPKARSCIHFDERGHCFHALGYGKATKTAAAIVVTSGTAVANLLPAVMEAYYERIPLLLLTADRPPELQQCGANQTCDQTKLFANHIRWQVEIPCPEKSLTDHYLAQTLCHASLMTRSGPVHINCQFREPLLGAMSDRSNLKHHIAFEHSELHPSEKTVVHWADILSREQKGVILAASGASEDVFALAEKLQWPILADILSVPRTHAHHPCLIAHFDPILKCQTKMQCDAIIHFGDRLVSKTLAEWMQKQPLKFYLHVSEDTMRQDPLHLTTHRVHACPSIFTKKLLSLLPQQENTEGLRPWKQWDTTCRQTLADFFSASCTLTEPGLITQIASFLSEEWAFFVGNSMPIRDANQFFLPKGRCGPIFGNRGVSGIDGNIATASGIAQGLQKPTFVLIGDLTLLHDLNSLALLSKSAQPLVICVINNSGGGIFSFLPIAKREEIFEEFIATSHPLSFAAAAELFNIPYFHPQTPAAFEEILLEQKKAPQSCLIEVTTDRKDNVRIHEEIIAALRTCLYSKCIN